MFLGLGTLPDVFLVIKTGNVQQEIRPSPAVFVATKTGILSQIKRFLNQNQVAVVPKPDQSKMQHQGTYVSLVLQKHTSLTLILVIVLFFRRLQQLESSSIWPVA